MEKLHSHLELAEGERQLLVNELAALRQKEELNQQQIQELKAALEKSDSMIEELKRAGSKSAETEKEILLLKSQITSLETHHKEALQQRDTDRQQIEKDLGMPLFFHSVKDPFSTPPSVSQQKPRKR